MTSNSKIEQWLFSNGVDNAIVKVGGQFFKINATLGIQPVSAEDMQRFSTIEPPDWLEAMCQEFVEVDRPSKLDETAGILKIPEAACPHCGETFNAASSLDGPIAPKSGDLTVCLACTEVLKFDENLMVVKVDETELNQMKREKPSFYAELREIQTWLREKNQLEGNQGNG